MGAACGPTEPEEADRDSEASDHGGDQALLRLDVAVGVELLLLDESQIGEEGTDGDERTAEDAEIGETEGALGEAVYLKEGDGEGFEPDVEKTVDEGDVQVAEEDHWLLEVEGDRSNKDHHRDILAGHLLTHQDRLAGKLVVSGKLLDAVHLAVENVGLGCFWQEEEEDDEGETREPHELPDGPGPALCHNCETSDGGTKRWAGDS